MKMISPNLSFSRTLPIDVFNQLGELLQQAQGVGNTTLVLTEAVLARCSHPSKWQQRFTVVVSAGFNALLIGKLAHHTSNEVSLLSQDDSLIDINLTFDADAIASFLLELRDLFKSDSQTYIDLSQYGQIAPNDAGLQGKFTILLLEYFLSQPERMVSKVPMNHLDYSVCQPVENALHKQIAQERLLNRVTTQIRKSLDLSVIMTTAIAQVREFLELDRLVIYKFEESIINQKPFLLAHPDFSGSDSHQPTQHHFSEYAGCIVYEACGSDKILSVLNYREENCFTPTTECWQKYRQGFTLAVNDVEKTYTLEKCLLEFLRKTKVRAKLVAPIICDDNLWGLLIAHQCSNPRDWVESEKNLLTAVAEQLAIAIHQSQLMSKLTQEKQNLEQRVIERTIDLHDALEAASAASRIRSEFLATISHELLTPLTHVIGMSSTLLRWSFGELTQRQRDYLQTIHNSGEHLLEMINDILDLSQIEAGKAVLNVSEFSLVDFAQTILDTSLSKAAAQQIELKLDLQIKTECDSFCADLRRVRQIISNLLSNAIKFTEVGGIVILRLWWEEDTAVFQVEDTGIGISAEQLSQLFEKFHQLDTPYRRRYEGAGLGLALTKQLVEMHRGRIEVESTVGEGSIFTVWIPLQQISVES
jgi:two-component system, sensor histidine kinase and response regulator